MLFSVGVDIVEIGRIRNLMDERAERFVRKVFSPEEISFCSKRVDKIACLAARFAAKEAFRKAIRASVPVEWHDVSVTSDADGGPVIKLAEEVRSKFSGRFAVSLSHSREYAVAVVLWERL